MSGRADAAANSGGPVRFVAADEAWHAASSIVLANDADVETIADRLPGLRVVALAFPKWTDGRAYSQARLLRVRHRFAGEIRATGDVVADMLPLLVRTGFDAVVLREGQSVAIARRALGFFKDGHYQGDVIEPRPRFGRGEGDPHPGPLPQAGEGGKASPLPQAGEGGRATA